jgi:hypothetical protein
LGHHDLDLLAIGWAHEFHVALVDDQAGLQPMRIADLTEPRALGERSSQILLIQWRAGPFGQYVVISLLLGNTRRRQHGARYGGGQRQTFPIELVFDNHLLSRTQLFL